MASPARMEPCPESKQIRALLISDVRLYREGLESALGRRNTIAIAGTARSISEALERVAALAPAVIVVDMSTRDSLPGIRALASAAPQSRIVAFAVDELASDIASCAEAGIAGYVPCEASIDDLVATIESVTREEAPCSPRVAAALFKRLAVLAGESGLSARTAVLSRREHEILTLVSSGLSNKEIAAALTIEVATVKNHIHNVLTKLNVSTRAAAVAVARRAPVRSRIAGI